MDMNLLREIVTVVSFVAFVAILAYVAYPGNRKRFDEAAQLPFEEDK
jgi:cytochrome c oxidase cbb3-type subunit IV